MNKDQVAEVDRREEQVFTRKQGGKERWYQHQRDRQLIRFARSWLHCIQSTLLSGCRLSLALYKRISQNFIVCKIIYHGYTNVGNLCCIVRRVYYLDKCGETVVFPCDATY